MRLRRWQWPRAMIAVLAMLATMTIVMVIVHAIGLRIVGGIAAWQRWLHAHAWLFVLWRLVLYALIARGWWWMRTRVHQRDPSPDARRRLIRAEIAAVFAIALTEIVAMRFPL